MMPLIFYRRKSVGLVMSESWQLFFYANFMVFPGSSIAQFSFTRYYLEIGKCRKEFIVSFMIAKDYFDFHPFTSIRDFSGEKQL